MPNARGTWQLAAAIRRQWLAADLDQTFRDAWGSQKDTVEFVPYNLDEARPGKHPRPYCIVEQGTPTVLGHHTGQTKDTEKQLQDVPVQFTIYGSSRDQVSEFAGKVAEAFDKVRLVMDDDGHVSTFRDPDFPLRLEDRTWAWVVQYRFRIEATFAGQYS